MGIFEPLLRSSAARLKYSDHIRMSFRNALENDLQAGQSGSRYSPLGPGYLAEAATVAQGGVAQVLNSLTDTTLGGTHRQLQVGYGLTINSEEPASSLSSNILSEV